METRRPNKPADSNFKFNSVGRSSPDAAPVKTQLSPREVKQITATVALVLLAAIVIYFVNASGVSGVSHTSSRPRHNGQNGSSEDSHSF